MNCHPTTIALLEAQLDLEEVLEGRNLKALPLGSDAKVDAAVMRAGEAAVTWLLAGGPDRDSQDRALNEHLGNLWKQRHEPPTRRAVERRRATSAFLGLPPEVQEGLAAFPPATLVELVRIQERIEQQGQLQALTLALKDIRPSMLDPMPVAFVGWDLSGTPTLLNVLQNLVQSVAGGLDPQVLLRLWSWLGFILQRALQAPACPVRAQQTEDPVSLMLVGTEGVVARLNVLFPGLPEDRLIPVQRAIYDLIAALMDAPLMESA